MRSSLQPIDRRCAVLLLTVPSVAAGATYTITDIGVLPGGSFSAAYAISNNGVVAGESTADGATVYANAVAWVDGRLIDLTGVAVSGSRSMGVNDSGVVVGISDELLLNAFEWTGGRISPLATFTDENSFSSARDINESGLIVGSAIHFFGGPFLAVTWNDGVIEALPGPEFSAAYAVNSRGMIVGEGSGTATDWLTHAMLWDDAGIHDLGTLGGAYSLANDINDRNEIVGSSTLVDDVLMPSRAFLWRDGAMSDLGTLGGGSAIANAINNNSVVVGGSYLFAPPFTTPIQHAFLWDDARMADLNDLIDPSSGWTLSEAMDINDHGQIVGRGVHNGLMRGFILTPADPADLDGSGAVDGLDLAILLGVWTGPATYSPCPPVQPADLDDDCKINGIDLALLLGAWGPA